MMSIFGYLVVLIFIKWMTNWNAESCTSNPNCVPPDLKAILIDMIMSPGVVPETNRLYHGQVFVQVRLFFTIGFCSHFSLRSLSIMLVCHCAKSRDNSFPPMSVRDCIDL